jgi:hypothetical protein
MDDADVELQERIDARSAKIILKAARRLRGIISFSWEEVNL